RLGVLVAPGSCPSARPASRLTLSHGHVRYGRVIRARPTIAEPRGVLMSERQLHLAPSSRLSPPTRRVLASFFGPHVFSRPFSEKTVPYMVDVWAGMRVAAGKRTAAIP